MKKVETCKQKLIEVLNEYNCVLSIIDGWSIEVEDGVNSEVLYEKEHNEEERLNKYW